MRAGADVETRFAHALAKIQRVVVDLVAQGRARREHLENLDRRRDQRGWQRVGEQIRTRALAQQVDDRLAARRETAAAAAERLAECGREDVHVAHHAVQFRRAAPSRADEAGRVRVVDHQQRVVFLLECDDLVELGDEAVHREHAIGRDQACALVLRFGQMLFELGHIAVRVTSALGLAQADAVDDRRVVERIGNHYILVAENRFEQAAVGVKATRVEDRVFATEERRDGPLEFLVQVLGAADEAHRGEPETVRVERLFRDGDDVRMVGEAKVVVRAEVQHLAVVPGADRRRLRRGDHALGLVQALVADRFEFGFDAGASGIVHGAFRFDERSYCPSSNTLAGMMRAASGSRSRRLLVAARQVALH